MRKHMTGTGKEWLAARLELPKAEKELTRRSDEVARARGVVAEAEIALASRDVQHQSSFSGLTL